MILVIAVIVAILFGIYYLYKYFFGSKPNKKDDVILTKLSNISNNMDKMQHTMCEYKDYMDNKINELCNLQESYNEMVKLKSQKITNKISCQDEEIKTSLDGRFIQHDDMLREQFYMSPYTTEIMEDNNEHHNIEENLKCVNNLCMIINELTHKEENKDEKSTRVEELSNNENID